MELNVSPGLDELFGELRVFERSKKPLEASWHRSAFQALLFLRRALRLSGGEAHGTYPWALNALPLHYRQVTHGRRNRVEALFSSLKAQTRRFNDNVNSRGVEEGLEWWSRFLEGFQLWRDIT